MRAITPQSQLIDGLLDLGWSIKKIEMKNGMYVARGYNDATGQEFDAKGQSVDMATAALYRYALNANAVRRHASRKYAAWDASWLDQKEQIAQAYAKMAPFEEKAVPAWKALAAESKIQADAIRQQIQVEVTDEPDPYMTAKDMRDDVHTRKHYTVSRADSNHPIWSAEDVVNFRIVHDVLGHCQSGGDYSWSGENAATAVHMPLVSPMAREALFTECIGRAAYGANFKGYGPHKVGFLSEFFHPHQKENGEHVWVPHGAIPQLQQPGAPGADGSDGATPNLTGPGQWVQPQQLIPSPVMAGDPAVMKGFDKPSSTHHSDPNQFWVPEDQATPIDPSENPEADYIDLVTTARNAAKIDTEWQSEPEPRQRTAIMNALRAALLEDAATYQQLMHFDPSTSADEMGKALGHEADPWAHTPLHEVERAGQHIEEIEDLANKDFKEDGGRGFLFRNGLTSLGIDPRVSSQAWLLLAPMSSELGVIDPHIARALRRPVDVISPRDYYKFERMQRALKDATGYGHVPLGLYHLGMSDMVRNPGGHLDHSALRVLDPTPWENAAQWGGVPTSMDYAGPIAFEHGRGAAEKAAIGFDAEFAHAPDHETPLVQPPGLGTPVPPGALHIIPATSMARPQRV